MTTRHLAGIGTFLWITFGPALAVAQEGLVGRADSPSVAGDAIATSYLGHAAHLPDPSEPAEVLLEYLGTVRHRALKAEDTEGAKRVNDSIGRWRSLAARYPESEYAARGLAEVLKLRSEATGRKEDARSALEAYQRAAWLALRAGKLRYPHEVTKLAVGLHDRGALDAYFSEALAEPLDRKDRHVAQIDYALGLSQLGYSDEADAQFEAAMESRVDGQMEAPLRFASWLMRSGRPAAAADLLERTFPASDRIALIAPALLRLRALRAAGVNSPAAEREVDQLPGRDVKTRPIGGGFSPPPQSLTAFASPNDSARQSPEATKTAAAGPSSPGVTAANAPPFYHLCPDDDCRFRDYTFPFADEQGMWFWPQCVNLAEVLWNEARGETVGSQAYVGWTVRDRVLLRLRVNASGQACNAYPGDLHYRSQCAGLPCGEPNDCSIGRWYCCAIHGATSGDLQPNYQFDTTHQDWADLVESGIVYTAWRVQNAFLVLSDGWSPPGTWNCYPSCTGTPPGHSFLGHLTGAG